MAGEICFNTGDFAWGFSPGGFWRQLLCVSLWFADLTISSGQPWVLAVVCWALPQPCLWLLLFNLFLPMALWAGHLFVCSSFYPPAPAFDAAHTESWGVTQDPHFKPFLTACHFWGVFPVLVLSYQKSVSCCFNLSCHFFSLKTSVFPPVCYFMRSLEFLILHIGIFFVKVAIYLVNLHLFFFFFFPVRLISLQLPYFPQQM